MKDNSEEELKIFGESELHGVRSVASKSGCSWLRRSAVDLGLDDVRRNGAADYGVLEVMGHR
jgi:hypothetical protein